MLRATVPASSRLGVAVAARVGGSACLLYATLFGAVAAAAVSTSVSVAVTDRVIEWVDSPAVRVRPASWSAVSDQVPSPLSVPADRVASAGTPLIRRVGAF